MELSIAKESAAAVASTTTLVRTLLIWMATIRKLDRNAAILSANEQCQQMRPAEDIISAPPHHEHIWQGK
jgi:hypothetical protein